MLVGYFADAQEARKAADELGKIGFAEADISIRSEEDHDPGDDDESHLADGSEDFTEETVEGWYHRTHARSSNSPGGAAGEGKTITRSEIRKSGKVRPGSWSLVVEAENDQIDKAFNLLRQWEGVEVR